MKGTSIIEEYKKLYESEMVAEYKHDAAKRTYKKYVNSAKPSELKSVDYSVPKSANFNYIPDAIDIEQSRQECLYWEQELNDIKKQRSTLEERIGCFEGKEKKVAIYKIQGLTNEQIAENLEISTRHVYRLLKKLN